MSDTDAAHVELYDIAKQKVDERFAELLMKMLPHEPDRNPTKDDVEVLGANTRTEMAELRTELRAGLAEVRTDFGVQIHEAIGAQTRTMVFGLLGSVTVIAIANTVALGIFN